MVLDSQRLEYLNAFRFKLIMPKTSLDAAALYVADARPIITCHRFHFALVQYYCNVQLPVSSHE
jgi:hypothetical protein